jgi:hypothetical protein
MILYSISILEKVKVNYLDYLQVGMLAHRCHPLITARSQLRVSYPGQNYRDLKFIRFSKDPPIHEGCYA